MKLLFLILLITLPFLAMAQEEPVEVDEASVHNSPGSIDPEKAKEIMEELGKGKKMREEQTQFLEELDTEE